jgi:hypothetical protein
MMETLIRKKVLDRYRLLGFYFTISIDGTGRLVFPERHCPNCLTRTRNGQTTYYHPVLEAKLITPIGFAFSIMTEFIENPGPKPTKQDCELKAFYRLAKRLKQRFPRLPICLLLDGLFAGGPTFALCEEYRWKYLVVLQEGDLSSVHEEFEALLPLAPENHLRFLTGVQREIQYLLQVAHIIAQLIERGSLFQKAFPAGVGSAKNIALRLLEAWRNFRLTDEHLHNMFSVRIQIRFKPP